MQSLLIHGNRGLERRYTPFKVIVLVNVSGLLKDEIHLVERMVATHNDKWMYQINNKWYKYFYFTIY